MGTTEEQHADMKRGQYRPTIFIGCGGTGAKVLQRMRMQALERFGGFSRDELPGVAFLSIDTDVAGAKAGAQDNNKVKSGGKEKIQKLCDFGSDERLNLDPGPLKAVTAGAEALRQYPHVAGWFEPKLLTITQRTDASMGAGQLRPLARVVAVTNYDNIIKKIDHAYGEVTRYDERSERGKRVNKQLPVQIIIVAGLAGGTGAGVFLEVAAMVRDRVPGASIQGRFVLPDVFRKVDSGPKLPANGYACLKEINHYFQHPYPARWNGQGPGRLVARIYDDVYIFGGVNMVGQTANKPAEIYSTIGDTLFLAFFQGKFTDDRASTLVNRHPVLMKTWKNVPQLQGNKWAVHSRLGGAPEVTAVALEQYPRKFSSSGIARLSTPSWRLLNHLSYHLARLLVDCLDSTDALLNDEAALKRDFAHRLGMYQGEISVDGLLRRQYAVVEQLGTYPSEGNDQARLVEELRGRFDDFTHPDHVQLLWDEKNCGLELRRRWDEVGAAFSGLRDEKSPGAYTKRINDNRRQLYASVKAGISDAIEHFCEQPYIGPYRIGAVMRRLAADIRTSEVFWIKEMEKRAMQASARASELRSDWDRWSKLAAEADTASIIFRRKPAFESQLQKAQEVAVGYWTAVSDEYVYEQAGQVLADLAKVLDHEVEQQEDMARRLVDMRAAFEAFAEEYASSESTAVNKELPLPADWIPHTLDYYLGDTSARRKEVLYALFERSKRELQITTNKELHTRLIRDKDGLARDLQFCCWRALHGRDGRTDWFGADEVKDGLVERTAFWTQLRDQYGSPNSPKLKELASSLVQQSLPWAKFDTGVAYPGGNPPLDIYMVLPKVSEADLEYIRAFKEVASAAARSLPNTNDQNITFVDGSDHSEVVCFSEIFAFIPASLQSVHGASGLAECFRRSSDKAKDNDPEGFLHTDLDTVQFDDLVPTSPEKADALFEAWKTFLLGVMLRVVKSQPNPLKPQDGEQQRLAPLFSFTYRGRGLNANQPLGQWQSAISILQSDLNVRRQLQDMINEQFVDQPAVRYEKLLGLARYYKQCIFPIRKPRADTNEAPVASAPYVAITKIENECLTSWESAVKYTPTDFGSIVELNGDGPRQLLWTLDNYASHTGAKDRGAALHLGMATYNDNGLPNYLEQPPAVDGQDSRQGPELLRDLKDQVFELLPPDLARNGALREQNPYYPWLALAHRYEVFLPSLHGAAPPKTSLKPTLRRRQVSEMSAVELVAHFEQCLADGAKQGGALVWDQAPSSQVGHWLPWQQIRKLAAAVAEAGLSLPAAAAAPSPLRPPPGADAPSPPPSLTLHYAGPEGQPIELPPGDIATRVRALPSGPHWVLVDGAWADAAGVPVVARLLAAPPKSALPPVPKAGGLPPLPSAPAAIPPGPFLYFIEGVHSDWNTVSGDALVALALAQALGAEGFVAENGNPRSVMEHPRLGPAIRDRRG